MTEPRAEAKWETVSTEDASAVRRLKIQGGWLYQVQTGSKWHDFNRGITKPVYGETTFVPDKPRHERVLA